MSRLELEALDKEITSYEILVASALRHPCYDALLGEKSCCQPGDLKQALPFMGNKKKSPGKALHQCF